MNETRTSTAAEPDGAPRLANLDILRGIAILGILFMNINAMGASALTARWAPVIGWTAIDQAAWFARQILADGTARCMLELLFGAGMVILTDRIAEQAGWWTAMRRYYLRNIVLVAFGLAHVFLLTWFGDILHIYGLAALLVFPLRKLPAQWLIAIGLLYAKSVTVMGRREITTIARENLLVAEASEHRAARQPLSKTEAEAQASTDKWHKKVVEEHKKITAENAERTATPVRWYRAMIGNWSENLGIGWLIYGLGEPSATLLIGAGLFKLGITQGQRSSGFYARLAIIAYLVGGTLRAVGTWQLSGFNDDVSIDWSAREIGRLSMTLGHIGLVSLLLKSAGGARLLAPFKAAGRTALTIYIGQTLICLWLLYPPFELGLYGKTGWAGLMATAFVVDALLLYAANIWVRHYRIAPVEWAWRSLVEWRRLPIRKRPAVARPEPINHSNGLPLPA